MKLITISCMVLCFFSISLSAQKTEKNQLKKSHKLSYEDFARKYGHNDTALAVIDVFFNKRESAGTYMSFLPLSAAVAPFLPLAGGMGILVSSPLFAKGAIMRFRYNKRRLSKVLLKLEKNEEIANSIERKYQKMLVIYQIEQAELMAMDNEGEIK